MKNIHVLPTDKPSRLYLNTKEYIFENEYSLSTDECQNKHIYITSDEEINEGDYFLYDETTVRYKTNGTEYHGGDLCHISGNRRYPVSKSKKIILTTDQDLIKDGVQAIDDEFLEWFVKNPSCEFVEVQKWFDGLDFLEYKIIIPKEETKQKLPIVNGSYGCTIETEKQETLEEVAENYKIKTIKSGRSHRVEYTKQIKLDFIAGAKWQQQQDKNKYSEEDLEVAYFEGREGLYSFNDWFKQFKNK
jgi:hypothetical protein